MYKLWSVIITIIFFSLLFTSAGGHSDFGLRREPDLTSPSRIIQDFHCTPIPRSMFQNYTFTN